jgi:mRNA-degrading endonuclease RelE of RelBE toxin-antitoxin system
MTDRYGIELTRRAEKDLDSFRQDRDRVVHEIQTLRTNPHAGHALKGAYRVCIIFVVGSHENIYKLAERRYAALLKSLD